MARERISSPRCIATLKDESPCRSVAVEGPYCKHHALAADAAQSSATGAPSPVPSVADISPAIAGDPPLLDAVAAGDALEPEPTEERGPQAIASLRAALKGDLSTDTVADLIGGMLIEALQASKDVYATCVHCQKRTHISLPDLGTRLAAARALMEELEGKLAAQTVSSADRVAQALEGRTRIEDLTNDELLLLTLENEGPDWDLREETRELARKVLAVKPPVEVEA